jgi:hypothetical protein
VSTRQLTEVERLVDGLSTVEQAQLLQHLALNTARLIGDRKDPPRRIPTAEHEQASNEFLRLATSLGPAIRPEG